jgi:hypothetical protein
MCELRDKLMPFGTSFTNYNGIYKTILVNLWQEGSRIVPDWNYRFKNNIRNFIVKFYLYDYFFEELIDAINWVCAMDEEKKSILEDFVETLEIQSNYIAGAVSLIDAKNEIMLLRNMIIRFHDEHKTWYHGDNKMFKVLYEAIRNYTLDNFDQFLNRELDDFMKDHVWNKLIQRLSLHLQVELEDNAQYVDYLMKIKSLTGKSVEKLHQLRDIIKEIRLPDDKAKAFSVPVMHTVMIDGVEVSCLMEVVWRYGVQLMCNWKEMKV